MSKRAEEKSIAYQLATHGPRVMGGDIILSEDDRKFWNINYDFKNGYEEAEKDLALTWEDIKTIEQIIATSDWYDFEINGKLWSKEFYEEVLKRFKEAKK